MSDTTREICLRAYLFCLALAGVGTAISVWKADADLWWLTRSVICFGAFLWGFAVAFFLSIAAIGVVAGACFIFLGHVPQEFQAMVP